MDISEIIEQASTVLRVAYGDAELIRKALEEETGKEPRRAGEAMARTKGIVATALSACAEKERILNPAAAAEFLAQNLSLVSSEMSRAWNDLPFEVREHVIEEGKATDDGQSAWGGIEKPSDMMERLTGWGEIGNKLQKATADVAVANVKVAQRETGLEGPGC